MKNEFVAVVKKADENLSFLEKVRDRVSLISTDELVSGFLEMRNFSSRMKLVADVVRSELLGNDERLGRFWESPDVLVDDRGHRYLTGTYGEVMQAERRVSVKLNREKAGEILESLGLLGDATDKEIVVDDPAELKKELEKLMLNIDNGNRLKLKSIINSHFKETRVINESKFNRLVAMKQVDPESMKQMCEVVENYAITRKDSLPVNLRKERASKAV